MTTPRTRKSSPTRRQDIRDLVRGMTFIAMMIGALFGYALLA